MPKLLDWTAMRGALNKQLFGLGMKFMIHRGLKWIEKCTKNYQPIQRAHALKIHQVVARP